MTNNKEVYIVGSKGKVWDSFFAIKLKEHRNGTVFVTETGNMIKSNNFKKIKHEI